MALGNEFHQFFRNWDFALGLLGEGDADGVANALGEQGTNADGGLDATVLALTCLGDTEVQGIVHVFTVHGLDKQAHGGDHDHGVGGLDGDDDIVEMLATEDAQELHAALDNALGGVAVAAHDAVGEGAVVHADAHGGVVLLTDIDKRHELLLNLLQLCGIFLVGVLQVLERAPGIYVVAGVDAHFLAILGSDVGGVGGEMNIGNEGLSVAVGLETGRDVAHVLGLAGALGGEAHELATGIDDALGL